MFPHPRPDVRALDASASIPPPGEAIPCAFILFTFFYTFSVGEKSNKRWNSNVFIAFFSYTFTLVYSFCMLKGVTNVGIPTFLLTLLLFSRLSIICIFCSKASNPNNSKGYEVRYTYFAPIFDAGSNQNQMQPDMDHGPFLGNPKADRSEAEGFWGGSLSLLSCCSMRVFLFKTVDR